MVVFFMHSEGRRLAAKPWCGGRHRVQRGGAAPTWIFSMKPSYEASLVFFLQVQQGMSALRQCKHITLSAAYVESNGSRFEMQSVLHVN